ncbi:hypothetical protein HMPREF0649_02132 [Segatella buccae D17]|nr:hypothetical protein HMPREF0649_02132 [Segatella buccae D17]
MTEKLSPTLNLFYICCRLDSLSLPNVKYSERAQNLLHFLVSPMLRKETKELKDKQRTKR